jgi:hypothetical protein
MYSWNIVENAARWVADYHSGTVLEAARCISDNRYLFRTSPAAENSGNRRRWNERASEREDDGARDEGERKAPRVRRGGRGNAGTGSPRCEKGSVVSASRFRPVIGSDSVLTLNARARSPALVRQRMEGSREGKGADFRDGRCHPTLHSPVLSSIIYDRAWFCFVYHNGPPASPFHLYLRTWRAGRTIGARSPRWIMSD